MSVVFWLIYKLFWHYFYVNTCRLTNLFGHSIITFHNKNKTKNNHPNKKRNKKQTNIKVAQNAPENKNSPVQSPTGENIDLTFYNTLTSKKGVMKAELSPEKQPLAPQSQDEEVLKGKFDIEAQKPPETVSEKNEMKEEAKPKQTALNIGPDKSRFTIQVASLKEEAKTGKISKKVSALGFKTEIMKVEVKGKGTMFRVMASGFETKVQAEEAAQKISSRTKTNCIVKSVVKTAKKN